jgi:hypothetical protein
MSKFLYGVEYLSEHDPNDSEHQSRKDRLCELPSGPRLLPDAFDCILTRVCVSDFTGTWADLTCTFAVCETRSTLGRTCVPRRKVESKVEESILPSRRQGTIYDLHFTKAPQVPATLPLPYPLSAWAVTRFDHVSLLFLHQTRVA